MLPNLGRVKEIGKAGLKSILLDGALLPLGMPRFAEDFKESDVDLLYEYLVRGQHNRRIEGATWY